MPWKHQSILFSGLRGPDGAHTPKLKEVVRWLRKVSQRDADPSQSYMAPSPAGLPSFLEMEKELEFQSCHYVHHLSDALRVVALHYMGGEDTPGVRAYARGLELFIASEVFHFKPETDEEYLARHRDRVDHG